MYRVQGVRRNSREKKRLKHERGFLVTVNRCGTVQAQYRAGRHTALYSAILCCAVLYCIVVYSSLELCPVHVLDARTSSRYVCLPVISNSALAAFSNPEVTAMHDAAAHYEHSTCLLYTSPSPRDGLLSRMPSSA